MRSVLPSATVNGSYDCEVVVVGLGVMGSCALWSLARRGVRAIGLDQFTPPHEQGSSHGETRLIRSAMLEGPAYVPLIRRAFELWDELGNESSQTLFVRAGVLFISPPGASNMAPMAAQALETVGLPYQALSDRICRRAIRNIATSQDWLRQSIRAADTSALNRPYRAHCTWPKRAAPPYCAKRT
jgi:glycine/D-amino acid oxidase-like deaminating enzyme